MKKEEYKTIPEFICVIDRSRSMYGKEKEIIESFNTWLASQKRNKKEFLVTLALCNEECELLYSRMPVKYVKPLDSFTYFTKGYTDYIKRVEEVLELLTGLMPSAVSEGSKREIGLCLITDGLDNSSSEEDREEFEKKLEDLKKQGWKVCISSHGIQEYSERIGA